MKLSGATFLLFLSSISIQAATLTPDEALKRLSPAQTSSMKAPGAHAAKFELRNTVTTSDAAPAVYIFSRGDNSLMFVAADDVATPLLGYTDSPSTGQLPPQLQWWLSEYAREIEYAKSAVPARSASAQQEEGNTNKALAPGRAEREYIAPMVTTAWNQGDPYNLLCPTVSGKHCVTGCVATAAAQIMKYHNYPETGQGSITYTPNPRTTGSAVYKDELSMDFSTVTFDWGNMLDRYSSSATDAQKNAVAKLMQAVGYASQMNYTTVESGAVTAVCTAALTKYFNYNTAAVELSRDTYGLYAWEDIIYRNLSTVGPVLYSGSSLTGGGHAFVCDGYAAGYYHFNWGWGGSYDGFFSLQSLTPESSGIGGNASSNYSFGQQAAINICKPDAPVITVNSAEFVSIGNLTVKNIDTKNRLIELTTDQEKLLVNSSASTHEVALRMVLTDENGKEYICESAYADSEVGPGSFFKSWIVRYNNPTIPDGTYTGRVEYHTADNPEYRPLGHSIGSVNYVTLTFTNGVPVSEPVEVPAIEITDFELLSPTHFGADFKISYTASNNSATELLDAVQPIFYTKAAASQASGIAPMASESEVSRIATGEGTLFDLRPGSSRSGSYVSSMKTSVSAIPQETTYIGLMSINTGKILAEKQISLETMPTTEPILTVSNFKFNGDPDNANSTNLSFSMNVKADQGYYPGSITVFIFPEEYGTSLTSLKSTPLFLSAGNSAETTATGSVSGLEVGKIYHALPYYKNGSSLVQANGNATFKVTSTVLATGDIADDPAEVAAILYDSASATVSVTAPAAISALIAYSLDGREIPLAAETTADGYASASVAHLQTGIYVIRACMADGSNAVAKFAIR